MLKNSLYSIFKFKCPRCNQGDFFESSNPYNLKKVGEFKEKCSHCGLKYSPEPGFYYGAMYVSYALGIALFVSIWVAISVLYPNYSLNELFIILGVALVIAGPYLYALSKTTWANLFFKYDASFNKNKPL